MTMERPLKMSHGMIRNRLSKTTAETESNQVELEPILRLSRLERFKSIGRGCVGWL
jgi:hypothetical protein